MKTTLALDVSILFVLILLMQCTSSFNALAGITEQTEC